MFARGAGTELAESQWRKDLLWGLREPGCEGRVWVWWACGGHSGQIRGARCAVSCAKAHGFGAGPSSGPPGLV